MEDADKTKVEKDLKIAKDLGVVRVEVWREVKGIKSVDQSQKGPTANDFSLAEKALCGQVISHRIG